MEIIANMIAIYLIQFGIFTFVRIMDKILFSKYKYILCIIPAFGILFGIFLVLKIALTDEIR